MARVALSLAILLLLMAFLLLIPAVQTFVARQATHIISERTETDVSIDRIAIQLPNKVGLRGLYVEDMQGDTLIHAGKLDVKVRIFSLLRNQVRVDNLSLSDATLNIKRNRPDSLYNFDHLIQAMAGGSENSQEEELLLEEKEPDDIPNKPGWTFDLGQITLDNIRFRLADHYIGMDLDLLVGRLDIYPDQVDLDGMQFLIEEICIADGDFDLLMYEATPRYRVEGQTASAFPEIGLGRLITNNLAFSFKDHKGFELQTVLKNLDVEPNEVDLQHLYFDLNHFFLDGLMAEIITPASNHQKEPAESVNSLSEAQSSPGFSFQWNKIMPISLKANDFQVQNGSFGMKNRGDGPPDPDKFDPANFQFQDLDIQVSDLLVTPDTLSVNFRQVALNMPESFRLVSFSSQIALGEDLTVRNLLVKTSESFVEADIVSSIPVLDLTFPIDLKHTFDLSHAKILLGQDIAFFVPEIGSLFPEGQERSPELAIDAGGTLQELEIRNVNLFFDNLIQLNAEGALVRNLTETDKLHMELPKLLLSATPKDLSKTFPGLLPAGMQLPDTLSVNAAFEGFLHDFVADAAVSSDFADIEMAFGLTEREGFEPEWSLNMQLRSAQPLAVAGQPDLLRDLDVAVEASGEGFDPETLAADLRMRVDSVWFNNYHYKDLHLEVRGYSGEFATGLNYRDEHLSLLLLTDVDLRQPEPKIRAEWEVNHLNAQELGFTKDLIALQTKLSADVVLTASDFFEGYLRLNETHVLQEREVYTLDSLTIETAKAANHYKVDLSAPFLQARYRGNISPALVPLAMASHINNYLNNDLIQVKPFDDPAQFNLSAYMESSPYVSRLLLPQVESYQPLNVNLSFDGDSGILFLDAGISELEMNGLHISGLNLKANSDPEYIDFSIRIPAIHADQLDLANIALTGELKRNKLDFDFSFDDGDEKGWLGVSGVLGLQDGYTEVVLKPDLLVNRRNWQVPPDNYFRFGHQTVEIRQMILSSDDKAIYVLSRDNEDGLSASLEVGFQNIDLGSIDLVGGEPLAEGLFNGHLILLDLFSRPAFTADLSIDGLGFRGDKIGDIRLLVDNEEANLFNVDASLSGFGNVVDVRGFYRHDDPPFLDMDVTLDRLDLSTLEALAFEELSDMEGLIRGRLRISGDPSAPELDGSLHFEELGFHVAFLNTHYRIMDEVILFDKDRVLFDRFSLDDRDNRQATLNGFIEYSDLRNIRFDLGLTSSNFLAMDIPKGSNELFFGRMLIDTDLNMSGTVSDPVVTGRFKLNRGSSFSMVLPQTTPQAIGDDGVVEFISIRDGLFADLLLEPDRPDPVMSSFQNLDLNINIEIDPQTQVIVIVDEHAGDNLDIRGGGVVSFGINPGGRISLAGRYEITEGAYQMTFYDVIRRNFTIKQGSSIVWTGDPLDAIVDITAGHSVRTSARELMATHTQSGGQQEAAFRRQYPFEVLLYMEGELMRPDIRFGIELPPEHRGAMEGRLQTRINELNQNESELNKQVFALLILGNFIQDDPLAGVTGGPGLSTTARTSASRLLSQQLNRLSDRYIRGVDLSFEVESYEELYDGQVVGRTELQMEISRDFLDERLRITAGGHLELEDETRRQLNPADIAGDFSVEYLLLPDGRLIARVFRERNFQDIYEGEVVETGVALIFRQSFDRFREIFRRRQEEGNER